MPNRVANDSTKIRTEIGKAFREVRNAYQRTDGTLNLRRHHLKNTPYAVETFRTPLQSAAGTFVSLLETNITSWGDVESMFDTAWDTWYEIHKLMQDLRAQLVAIDGELATLMLENTGEARLKPEVALPVANMYTRATAIGWLHSLVDQAQDHASRHLTRVQAELSTTRVQMSPAAF